MKQSSKSDFRSQESRATWKITELLKTIPISEKDILSGDFKELRKKYGPDPTA